MAHTMTRRLRRTMEISPPLNALWPLLFLASLHGAWHARRSIIQKKGSAVGIPGIEGISDKTGKVHHLNRDVVEHVLFAMMGE